MEENNHRKVGHEETDVDPWQIGKFAMALAAVCAISLALLFGFFHYLLSQEGGKATKEVKLPPKPRLEERPPVELKAVRDAEDRELTSYGWVDKEKGIVHLPIDRAIDMLSQKGLPARSEVPAGPTVSMPTESGLGINPAGGAK